MSKVWTGTFVRTEFMKLELIGLASSTINNQWVERILEYGITKGVLRTLKLFLYDSDKRVLGL